MLVIVCYFDEIFVTEHLEPNWILCVLIDRYLYLFETRNSENFREMDETKLE